MPSNKPARHRITRLWSRPVDLLGLALALLYAAPALVYPHGNDQALHWYIGQGILLGELPFESGVSGKPIGIFVVHAMSGVLFGNAQWAIRALEALTLLIMAPLLVTLLRTPGGERPRDGEVATAAVVLFSIHYTFFDYWDISHPETWVGLCTLAATCVALHDRRPARRVTLVGVLCGAGFMIKYTAAVIALPIAAFCGLRAMLAARDRGSHPMTALFVAAGLFLLGVGAVFILCVLPFVIGGALEPMWEVLYTFTARYVKQAPGVPYTALWTRLIFGGGALIASGAALSIGLSVSALRSQTRALQRGLLLLAITLAALLSVWLQKRFFSYHFMVAAPWLSACIVYGLRAVLAHRARITSTLAIALAAAALWLEPAWCSHPKMSYARHMERTEAYLRGKMKRWSYLAAFTGMNYLDQYRVHERIGLEAKRRSRPGDQLCARGFAPAVYQVSGMRCPSRHVIQMWPAGLPEWESEFHATIRKHRPRFIVTFADRPHEVRQYRRLGYRPTRMPSIYLLMEHRGPRMQDTPTSRGLQ